MYHYYCLNQISEAGMEGMTEQYVPVSDPGKADAILWTNVRRGGLLYLIHPAQMQMV